MNVLKKMFAGFVAIGLIAAAPIAGAVTFTVTAASFLEGIGYGTDPGNSSNNLDVLFSTAAFSALTPTQKTFELNTVGESYTFNFGSVQLSETDISNNETNDLNVNASLTFSAPFSGTKTITAAGVATTGTVSDLAVDYTLTWAPSIFDFGTGGQFEFSLNNLSFSNIGTQPESATITLVKLPSTAVPEPTSVALLGLGLLGVAASRRKAAKRTNA